MAKEIIINAEGKQTRIAIVERGELAEFHIEDAEHSRTLGDIYLGRIRYMEPSLRAAFVDIGQEKSAFLHFSNLSENLDAILEFVRQEEPRVTTFYPAWLEDPARKEKEKPAAPPPPRGRFRRLGSPDSLKRGQPVLVRVVKEPIANKASRVSSDISLAGRFLILVPLSDTVAVSRKIVSHGERRRLRELMKMLIPAGFGVIVRTAAKGKDVRSLDTDLKLLLERWRKIEDKLSGSPQKTERVHEDLTLVSSIIRDLFSSDYDRILIDDRRMYRNIKNYIQAVAPRMVPAVQLHAGKQHIFEKTGLQQDINSVFDKKVSMPSGGYLFIERTEAMYVIDVNSGRSGRGLTQEEKSLNVNLEAVRVLARQVRLRDIGGIIVVDFISMREERNKKRVFKELQQHLEADRASTAVLPMSDFGLIEITRQRIRPSVTMTHAVADGSVDSEQSEATKTPADWVETVEERLDLYMLDSGTKRNACIRVHPFAASYLNRGLVSLRWKWQLRYRVQIRLEIDDTLDPMDFRCMDPDTGEDMTFSVDQPTSSSDNVMEEPEPPPAPRRRQGRGGKSHSKKRPAQPTKKNTKENERRNGSQGKQHSRGKQKRTPAAKKKMEDDGKTVSPRKS